MFNAVGNKLKYGAMAAAVMSVITNLIQAQYPEFQESPWMQDGIVWVIALVVMFAKRETDATKARMMTVR